MVLVHALVQTHVDLHERAVLGMDLVHFATDHPWRRIGIVRTMGHAPDVLEATLALNKAIQHELPGKLRELAYLKTSQLNGCDY